MRAKIWRKFLEIFIDFILVVIAFFVAFYLRIGKFYSTDFPFDPYYKLSIIASFAFILLFAWSGLYLFDHKSLWKKFRIISISCLSGSAFFVLIFFFNREIFFSRLILLLIFLLSTIFVWGFHVYVFWLDKMLWRKQKNVSRVLIIGANRAAEKIIRKFQMNNTEHIPVVILAPHGSSKKEILGVPIVGKLDAFEKTVKGYDIDEIIQCDAVEQSLNLLTFAEGNFLQFRVSPEVLGAFNQNFVSQNLDGLPLLSLKISPLFGWGQIFKRLFDIVFSLFLLIILIPIFVLIFIIRKIIAPKSFVFYCETKARGFEDKFQMVTFFIDEKTKWGNFLKRTFLVDFPEILNVFTGKMSLVGPRPSTVKEREDMSLHFKRRLVLKPGVTGLWQLEKLKGKEDNVEKMVELDVRYIHRWSFFSDIKILIQTLFLLIKRIFK